MRIAISVEFARQAKRLSRKHRLLFDDIEQFIETLKKGERPGKPMAGLSGIPVHWARLPNSSAKRGKSGGFRIVYYFDDANICLLMIGARNEFGSVPPHRVLDILRKAGFSQT